MRSPAITRRKIRKRWILAIFAVFLMACLLCLKPICQTVKAQAQSTNSFADNFSTNTGAWQYLGSAYRDPTNEDVVLTNSGNYEAGVAWFRSPIQGPFEANFSYIVGGGSYHGDGFTMFFYKQQYTSLANGGDLAFTGLNAIVPGYGIEFDGWQNIAQDFQSIGGQINPPQGDPSDAYIGLIKDSAGNHLAYVNDPRVDDGQWHQVSVVVGASSVSVYVDKGLVLQWSGELNRTYSGFGFSGATGEVGDNWHIIGNFSITAQNMRQPAISTSCVASVSQSSLNVEINGNLIYNGEGIPGAPVLLSYSVTGGESWQDLTLVNTDSDGNFLAEWFPSVTGDYLINATYAGDSSYSCVSTVVNLVIVPFTSQNAQDVFSVASNSTVTDLAFNSTSRELSFNVSGPSGTTGYVDAYIAKSLVGDISALKVYLDGNKLNYSVTSQGDSWLIYFNYHHSTHEVIIDLNRAPAATALSLTELLQGVAYGAIVSLSVIVILLLILRKDRAKRPTTNKFRLSVRFLIPQNQTVNPIH
jgi:hypothetical protein